MFQELIRTHGEQEEHDDHIDIKELEIKMTMRDRNQKMKWVTTEAIF